MPTQPPFDKPGAADRPTYGPKPIGALLPRVTRAAFRSKGAVSARLMADWPQIVGRELAGMTTPRRIHAGVLTINCSGPMALELQHSSAQVLDRINTHLGNIVVKKLGFVQEPPPARPASPLPMPPPSDPVIIEGIPDGPLREALAALGALVKAP